MGVQSSDENQGRLDHNVVIINGHFLLNPSFKLDMVTDIAEPNIEVMGECPFILVHTPVNYITKKHGLIVSSDAYNTRTWSEESVRKSILSSHPETLKLYEQFLPSETVLPGVIVAWNDNYTFTLLSDFVTEITF